MALDFLKSDEAKLEITLDRYPYLSKEYNNGRVNGRWPGHSVDL